MDGLALILVLPVTACPSCGDDHEPLRFTPGDGPSPGETHRATCPITGVDFWMNTRVHPGVWERLLAAAGFAAGTPL